MIFIFVACSGQCETEDYEAEEYDETQYEEEYSIAGEEPAVFIEYEIEYEMAEIEGIMRRIMPFGSLTIEHFLEDIDYMIYVLENNFPLLDVAYWARGIDYMELANSAREAVMSMEEPCEDTFLAILRYHFMPLAGTGHFMVISHYIYEHMMSGVFYGGYNGIKWTRNQWLLRSPLASRFYDRCQDRIGAHDAAWERLIAAYGMPEHRFQAAEIHQQPVTTKSLEENRIAYVSTGRNMAGLQEGASQIADFFAQITEYDHLIIDLRGNGGGNIDAFLNVILRPNLREAIESPNAFLFFMDGPHVRRFGERLFEPTIQNGFMTIFGSYSPVEEILANYYIPDISHEDIERFHYGAPAGRLRAMAITPTGGMSNRATAFEGEIWLLTDHIIGSGAQLAAWYAKETGFVTLVGDISGGVFGGPRTLVLMPNTGIALYFDIFYITDSRGRPLEAGTIPHHFNRPGLDALETVLELIAEGEY